MSDTHGPKPGTYCACCYSDAAKAGRATRPVPGLTKYELCGLCESRLRAGLIHYEPSNGTEFEIFMGQCFRCRHYIDDTENPKPGRLEPPFNACAWGVLDRFYAAMPWGHDHIGYWFDPADLEPSKDDPPPDCKRFMHKDDPRGEFYDPPTPDVGGQLTFEDALEVPERVVKLPVLA